MTIKKITTIPWTKLTGYSPKADDPNDVRCRVFVSIGPTVVLQFFGTEHTNFDFHRDVISCIPIWCTTLLGDGILLLILHSNFGHKTALAAK